MNQRLILYISLLLSFSTCQEEKLNFTVNGKFTGKPGSLVILEELTLSELQPVDSSILNSEGEFSLRGYTDINTFYIVKTSDDDYVNLLIGPGDKVSIYGEAGNLQKTYDITGSEDSRRIRKLTLELNSTLDAIKNLGKTFNENTLSPDFLEIKAQLDSIYNQTIEDHREFTFQFIRKNLNSMACLMALYQQISPRHSLLDYRKDFEYFEMVDSSLSIHYPESEAVRELHRQVIEIREQKKIEKMNSIRLGQGTVAPEIYLPGPDGDTILLSSFRGKYVLLDFWASWCSPCRIENPNLVKAYNQHKEHGFEIVQVSLDRSREAWLKAIVDDQLNWTHMSDLKMWNSVVVPVYNIQGIPINFLLDPDGKIIDQNLRGINLEKKLAEIFKE